MCQPLILTLLLDAASEKLLTTLRTSYFPKARNYLNAHVTLFHALPPSSYDIYTQSLSRIASRERPFIIGIKTPFLLGRRGVGLNLASHKLRILHQELLEMWREEGIQLTEQDKRTLKAHVTVQNKVTEEEARETLEKVQRQFREMACKGEGFSLWRYEETGTWSHLEDFRFSKEE